MVPRALVRGNSQPRGTQPADSCRKGQSPDRGRHKEPQLTNKARQEKVPQPKWGTCTQQRLTGLVGQTSFTTVSCANQQVGQGTSPTTTGGVPNPPTCYTLADNQKQAERTGDMAQPPCPKGRQTECQAPAWDAPAQRRYTKDKHQNGGHSMMDTKRQEHIQHTGQTWSGQPE